MAGKTAAEAYREQGYEVTERNGSIVLDIPNPDVTGDDYFHGENPHTAGFSSHGLAAEGGGNDLTVQNNDGVGEATADVQNRNDDRAGWNQQAGSVGDGGEPDESWTNARIRAWAEQNNRDVSGASTKNELLDAVRGG